jgi:hypothetical protein
MSEADDIHGVLARGERPPTNDGRVQAERNNNSSIGAQPERETEQNHFMTPLKRDLAELRKTHNAVSSEFRRQALAMVNATLRDQRKKLPNAYIESMRWYQALPATHRFFEEAHTSHSRDAFVNFIQHAKDRFAAIVDAGPSAEFALLVELSMMSCVSWPIKTLNLFVCGDAAVDKSLIFKIVSKVLPPGMWREGTASIAGADDLHADYNDDVTEAHVGIHLDKSTQHNSLCGTYNGHPPSLESMIGSHAWIETASRASMIGCTTNLLDEANANAAIHKCKLLNVYTMVIECYVHLGVMRDVDMSTFDTVFASIEDHLSHHNITIRDVRQKHMIRSIARDSTVRSAVSAIVSDAARDIRFDRNNTYVNFFDKSYEFVQLIEPLLVCTRSIVLFAVQLSRSRWTEPTMHDSFADVIRSFADCSPHASPIVEEQAASGPPTTTTNQESNIVVGCSSSDTGSSVATSTTGRAPTPVNDEVVPSDISRVRLAMETLGRYPKKENAPIEDEVLCAIPNALHESLFEKLAIRPWERAARRNELPSIVEYMRFVVQFVDLSGRLSNHSTEVLADRIADEMYRQLIGVFAELDSIDSSAEDGGTIISLGNEDTTDSSEDSFVDGSLLGSDGSEEWKADSESSSESIEDRKERERERKRRHKKDKHKKKRQKKHKKEKKHKD